MCKGFSIKYLILIICIILWIVKFFAWFTPTNTLVANGFGALTIFDLVVSFTFGLLVSFYVYKTRLSYSNKYLFWSNQILSFALVLPSVGVVFMAFYAVFVLGA
jgi:hypothetical protein